MSRRSAQLSVAVSVSLAVIAFAWGGGTVATGDAAGGRFPGFGHHTVTTPGSKIMQRKPRTLVQRRAAAFNHAAARLSQSGVTCEPEAPPDAVQACAGKNAGDTCTVGHEEHSFTGQCALIPGGVLACQPPPPPPPSPGAIDACAGKAPGDSCMLQTEDHSAAGVCRTFASGVVACVKAPVSLLAAIDACTGKAAGDACTFAEDEDESVTGACTPVPGLEETLVCVPPERIPPAVAACEGHDSGDGCSFDHDDVTLTGTCVMPPGQSILVCQPEPPPVGDPCAGKSEGDACTFIHDGETVGGTCAAIPGGALACVPNRLIPPAVAACSGMSAGAACTFTRDGRTIGGDCVAIPDHDLLVCDPPPPQALIDACVDKAAGDACSATLGDRQFTGACATALDGVTLVCLPTTHGDDEDDQGDDDQGDSDREAACQGLPAGALCSVMVGDKVQNGTCRRDDDDDESLACLPPAPPQEAVDACTGLVSGDSCSFPWNGVTVSGACRPLPGAAALVCAPLCPRAHNIRR